MQIVPLSKNPGKHDVQAPVILSYPLQFGLIGTHTWVVWEKKYRFEQLRQTVPLNLIQFGSLLVGFGVGRGVGVGFGVELGLHLF